MKTLLFLSLAAIIGSLVGALAMHKLIAEETYAHGYNSGRAAAQVDIALKVGEVFGAYRDGKHRQHGTLYDVKDMSVVIVETDGIKTLRLWH